jgi:ubiquinone/menaquinone biosynthesis C-methylase UbiE/DNA-binding winged helix-turn-helix (wHTH) protein
LPFQFEDFVLDPDRRELRRAGKPVAVEPQVFDLINYLIRNREHVVTRGDLLDAVWNGRIVSESTLATRINAARRALSSARANNQGYLNVKSMRSQSQSVSLPLSSNSAINPRETNMSATAVLKTVAPAQPDFAAIKARQQGAWSSGDYAIVGTTLQIVGEELCEALDLRPGSKVLDVAAGNGNVTLAAARRWCDVTSTDYVPALLDRGRERAAAEHLKVEFREADAEALPFAEESFDVVVSTFGVMFTPDQDKAASELLRVCRSGGKIGMANWTPEGFIGQLFKTLGKHLPPPAGVKSPALWGTRTLLEEMFGEAGDIDAQPRMFVFRYKSPEHWLDVFKTYYGPMFKAFGALESEKQKALATDLIALVAQFNRATDGTVAVRSEYLEVIITKH